MISSKVGGLCENTHGHQTNFYYKSKRLINILFLLSLIFLLSDFLLQKQECRKKKKEHIIEAFEE